MRTEKPKRPGRSDNPGRQGRPARPVKTSRPERPEKTGSPERTERPERPKTAGRPARPGKFVKPAGGGHDEKPGRYKTAAGSERSEKPAKYKTAAASERSERPERISKPVRAGRVEKPERAVRARAAEKPERIEKPAGKGRGDKTFKLDRAALPELTTKARKVVKRGEKPDDPDTMRLNKYISNSGICSRREADRLIEAGAVSVNGKIVTELGTKVGPADKVQYGDQTINREKPKYVLLNKPKGYITTVDDPDDRKTVMSLVAGACRERIYPVGRLDRNTTGLLLFTNDGMIAKKLTHPRYGIKKIYHVEIDKALTRADYLKIEGGFRLEEEMIQVDSIEYIGDGKDKKQIGIELHSGQNRIVRRIFEHFDYKVLRLDRVYYAGLTKKNLPRGHWRLLKEQENT